ncbi:MFS transporter [Corynebacterium lujinxingii]|nr:MFS transporter [Corynebacterium lujinxingii]
MNTRTAHNQFPVVPLAAMSFAAFVYVTFEMFAVGLISPMARDLGVSEGQIGLLMSVYAGLVAVVTIPLIHVTRNVNRRPLLIATLVFLLAGIVLQATAANYWMLVAGRVTAAFTHGVFWSLVNPMASRLAPPGQTGKAVAAVSIGSTLSLVLGSPLTTALGAAIGWRASTWVLGVATIASLAMLFTSLPSMPATRTASAAKAKNTKSAIPSLVVYVLLAVTSIFATFTYLALLVEATAGHRFVPYGVSLYGFAGLVGITFVGRRVDRRMIRLNAVAAATLVVSAIAGLAALSSGAGVGMFVVIAIFGMAAGALPTVATTIFLHAGQRNQDLASSVYVVTFQVGIASGSALGAAAVDAGYLSGTLALTGVLGALAFAVLALWSRTLLR